MLCLHPSLVCNARYHTTDHLTEFRVAVTFQRDSFVAAATAALIDIFALLDWLMHHDALIIAPSLHCAVAIMRSAVDCLIGSLLCD